MSDDPAHLVSRAITSNWSLGQRRACTYEALYNNLIEYTKRCNSEEIEPNFEVMVSKTMYLLKKLESYRVFESWEISNMIFGGAKTIMIKYGPDTSDVVRISTSLEELEAKANEHKTEEVLEI